MNALRHIIIGDSGRVRPLAVIYALAIVLNIVVYALTPYIMIGDSGSYVIAWDDALSHGRLDGWRTPLLPLIIGAAKCIAPSAFLQAVIVFQFLVWLPTIYVFCRIAQRLIHGRRAVWIATAIYALYYPTAYYNSLLLSESLATSLVCYAVAMMLVIYDRTRSVDGSGLRRLIYPVALMSLMVTLMVSLRPALMVIPIAFATFWLFSLMLRGSRRFGVALLTTCIAPAIYTMIYICAFHSEFGRYGLTDVSVFNRYYHIRFHSLVFPEYLADDPDVIAYMTERNAEMPNDDYIYRHTMIFNEIMALYPTWGIDKMTEYTDRVWHDHPDLVWKWTTQAFVRSITDPVYWKYTLLLVMMTIYSAMCIVAWRKRRQISAFALLLLIIQWGNIVTNAILGPADWVRLIHPTLPIIFVMLGQILATLSLRPLRMSLIKTDPSNV